MANISFNALVAVDATEVTSREMAVKLEWNKLSDEIRGQLMIHGAVQKISDAASGAAKDACIAHFGTADFNKADAKAWLETESGKKAAQESTLRMMQKALDALYDGRWAIREGTGTVEKKTPLQALILDLAKAALTTVFNTAAAAKGVKPTFANYVTLSPAVAKYFDTSGKRPTWLDAQVMEYVSAQKAAGKRDFEADAMAELAKNAALAESVQLDDLLGDI